MSLLKIKNAKKMCVNKKSFKYARDADIALNNMIKKNGLNSKEKLHVYYCPCCLNWHIGHYKIQMEI